jgi:D-beta-D-heptose 7-phosphate kinase/D-beta-D-heptose 1-phosphate adenosyltransferase
MEYPFNVNNLNYIGPGSFIEDKDKKQYIGNAVFLSLDKLDYTEDRKIIYDLEQLKILKNTILRDKKVVLTSGCFDILHVGHLSILKNSKNLGDILIVCLSNDKQIKALKGDNRPINNYQDRLELFKTISYVDYVIIYDEEDIEKELTLDTIMKIIDPDVWTKGDDYTVENIRQKHPTLKNIHLFKNIEDKSTTNIIKKINLI